MNYSNVFITRKTQLVSSTDSGAGQSGGYLNAKLIRNAHRVGISVENASDQLDLSCVSSPLL